MPAEVAIYNSERQDHGLDKVLDHKLIELAREALEEKKPVKLELPISNVDRTAGAMLSGEIAKRYGHAGLPEDTIWVELQGHGRPELRRLPRARRHARSRRRRQRLCRQGPVRRPHHRPARRQTRASCRRSRSSSATRCCTAPSPASAISAASPASASPCATPAPSPWSKAPATMAANT